MAKQRRIPIGYVTKRKLQNMMRRFFADMGSPFRPARLRTSKAAPFHDIPIPNYCGDERTGEELLFGLYNYSGQSLNIADKVKPWQSPAPSERYAYWLHSFDWLQDLLAVTGPEKSQHAISMIDGWIDEFGQWNAYSWQPDIIAGRLFSWFNFWTDHISEGGQSESSKKRRIAALRQLKYLKSNYKKTAPGVPRFRAAGALVLGGLLLSEKADGYLDRGLDWLNDEIDDQILPDGGHVSRSPEQALEVLQILSVVNHAMNIRGIDSSKIFQRAFDRVRHVVPFFRSADGGLVCFNGGSEGNVSALKGLIDNSDFKSKPFVYCPHSGYQRIEQNGTILHVDTGETSPFPYDDNAHLAPLSFELSNPAGRLIVNCGWAKTQPAKWRQAVRLTAAHSALTLNKTPAGDLLTGYKSKTLGPVVQRGIEEVKASRKDQPTGVWLEMHHDGYRENTGLVHRRRIYVKNDGHDIRGEDSLLLPVGDTPLSRDSYVFDIRFHLHPSVRATLAHDLQSALLIQPGHVGWRFRTDGGPLRIEDSVYLGKDDRPIKSLQIVISGEAFADSDGETRSNRVRWSMRRLEARK